MKSFLFERELVTKKMVEWVEQNPGNILCRKMFYAHLRAQKSMEKVDIESYEIALTNLSRSCPWDETSGIIVVGG